MWFGKKASLLWLSCLSKEAENLCTLIKALDWQLTNLKPQESSWITTYYHHDQVMHHGGDFPGLLSSNCTSKLVLVNAENLWIQGTDKEGHLTTLVFLPFNTSCGFGISPLQRKARGEKRHSTYSSCPTTRGGEITKECAIFSLRNFCHTFSA